MATYYITQLGAGLGDGTSLGNAWSAAAFNTSANWSATPATSGKISPGDTVIASGTFTTALTFQGSGTSGNVIVLSFVIGAKMSAAAWASTGAINASAKNYLSVLNVTIENTDNGTSGSYGNTVASKGIVLTNCSNITIDGVEIKNIYVRTSTSDIFEGSLGIDFLHGSGAAALSSNIVRNCTIYDVQTGIGMNYRPNGISGIRIYGNLIYNTNHGIRIGQASVDGVASDIEIYDNEIRNFSKWDDLTVANTFHHNGVFVYSNSSGTSLTNLLIYANKFGPDFGTRSTSGTYLEGTVEGIVHSNIYVASAGDDPENGFVTFKPWANAIMRAYNNTISATGTGRGIYLNNVLANSSNSIIVLNNNIVQGCTAITQTYSGNIALTSNNNLFYNLIVGQNFSSSTTGSGSFKTFLQWQGLGYDSISLDANPLLSAEYMPINGSPVIGVGTNLSAYFTTDYAGTTRLQWDIGAYAYLRVSLKRLASHLKLKGLAYD